jgi:pSer/pThr/pTyr-binding forkhead associated (FHA) protein
MIERVILHVTAGVLKGQDFVLENETNYILGRSRDCSLCLPDSICMVSRRHCRIKVSAPFVHIEDLGSLNGTYVNEAKIGQRDKKQSFEEALQADHAEHLLEDGDELRIGHHVFRVEFVPPPPCAAAETRDQQQLWSGSCAACR